MKANAPSIPELSPGQVATPNALNLTSAYHTLFLIKSYGGVEIVHACTAWQSVSFLQTTDSTHLNCRVVQLPAVLLGGLSCIRNDWWLIWLFLSAIVPRWLYRGAPRELHCRQYPSAFGMPESIKGFAACDKKTSSMCSGKMRKGGDLCPERPDSLLTVAVGSYEHAVASGERPPDSVSHHIDNLM